MANSTSIPAARGGAAHFLVKGAGAVAELEHLAQHRHAARRRPVPGEDIQRLTRGGRIGVVAVVDDRHAARESDDLTAMRRRPESPRALGNCLERHVEFDGHRGRRQHVGEIPASDERRRHIERSPRRS